MPDGGGRLAQYLAGIAEADIRFRKGDVLYAQGDPSDSLFQIRDGTAKTTVVSEDGKEAVVGLLGPGRFCGEGCLTGAASRSCTLAGMSSGIAIEVPKAAILDLVREKPDFAELFALALVRRNFELEADLVDQLFSSSERRLARLLLNLAQHGTDEPALVPRISQETLAGMIGTTRSRVNFFMNKFRQLGFIEYGRQLRVHRSLATVLTQDPV